MTQCEQGAGIVSNPGYCPDCKESGWACRCGREPLPNGDQPPTAPRAIVSDAPLQGDDAELVERALGLLRSATHVSGEIIREDRSDGEERFIVKGVPCGLPVAKFGDACDAEFFVAIRGPVRQLAERLSARIAESDDRDRRIAELELIVRAYVDPTEVKADMEPIVASINAKFDCRSQQTKDNRDG